MTLAEQAAQTEATAPSMGFAEVGIAASTENSAGVAGPTVMIVSTALLVETPRPDEAIEVLAGH